MPLFRVFSNGHMIYTFTSVKDASVSPNAISLSNKNIVAEKWYWPDVPVHDPSLARLPEINAESGLNGMRN